METIIRTVRDLEADERKVYEALLGHHLQENQQVVIRVLTPGVVPPQDVRREALGKVAEIARKGRENARAQGVSEAEVNEAIDEAMQQVRSSQRS